MYEVRKELEDSLPGVYINEDLTRENSKLAYEARQLKRRQRILDTLTRNGRVYIRCAPEDKPVIFRDMNEVMEKNELSRPQPRPAQEERSAASSSTMSESMFRLPPPISTQPIPGTPLLAPHRELSLTMRQKSWVVLAGVRRLKSLLRTTILTIPLNRIWLQSQTKNCPMTTMYAHYI